MGQASSDLSVNIGNSSYSNLRIDEAYDAIMRNKTVEAWTAELRAFVRDHAPANYANLKFDAVCGDDCTVLRGQLASLGATAPSCVYAKKLLKLPEIQAAIRHGRLSIGGKHLGRHITATLTDGEIDAIIDYSGETGGMAVPVFDSAGRRYEFKMAYAENTYFYRLVGAAEYERFMVDNHVVRDVHELGKELFMEVWAFRSPALRCKGNMSYDDHQVGALGMVILFLDLDADGLGDEILDDDSLTIKHLMRHYPKVPEGYTLE
ncbi:hypothetical protein EJB05_35365, partial [Eragrostis curvula]